MAAERPGLGLETVGRESELADLRAFVEGSPGSRLFVISGPPGIGKTTLWEGATAAAAEAGLVLSARAAESEAGMPFAGLVDLLAGVDLGVVSISAPQRAALEVALLRREASEPPPPTHAIALAVIEVLRELAARSTVLLAIDDLQWLDQPTVEVLAFAIRRTSGPRLRVLVARRPGPSSAVELAVPRGETRALELEGLSLGATRRLLVRIGFDPTRRVLGQVHEVTLGNPLFALEIGRVLKRTGGPAIGQTLQLPESLDELLAAKVLATEPTREALLAVALGGNLSDTELRSVVSSSAVDAALDAELIAEIEHRVRPTHPLYAAAVVGRARPDQQREMHTRLAAVAVDPIRRARHHAAAATTPATELAEQIDAGASSSRSRGDLRVAIELAEHALRLTPDGDPARGRRVLALAYDLLTADERDRLRSLMRAEFDRLAPGDDRAAGHLLMAHVTASQEEFEGHYAAVLRETTDPGLRARALAALAIDDAGALIRNFVVAEARALEAMAIAPIGPALFEAVHGAGWARLMRGQPLTSLRESLHGQDHADFSYSFARVEAIRHIVRGEVDIARAIFRADETTPTRPARKMPGTMRSTSCARSSSVRATSTRQSR